MVKFYIGQILPSNWKKSNWITSSINHWFANSIFFNIPIPYIFLLSSKQLSLLYFLLMLNCFHFIYFSVWKRQKVQRKRWRSLNYWSYYRLRRSSQLTLYLGISRRAGKGPSIKDVGIFWDIFDSPSPMSEFQSWLHPPIPRGPSNILQHQNLRPPSTPKIFRRLLWMAPNNSPGPI